MFVVWLLVLLQVPPTREQLQHRLDAALLHRAGKLPRLPKAKADQYFQEALKAQLPKACLEQARTLLDDRKADPEPYLRCAAPSLPEAQYLLGRFILNHTAAEDEPHRFEGLAWLALAAKAGYSPAIRRWELLAADLPFEDLERVEQKSQMLVTR